MKIYLSEQKFNRIKSKIRENIECENDKILSVKKYLDGKYNRTYYSSEDGNKAAVSLKNGNNSTLISIIKVFYECQEVFKKLFADNSYLDKMLAKIIKAWYNNKIDRNGCIMP